MCLSASLWRHRDATKTAFSFGNPVLDIIICLQAQYHGYYRIRMQLELYQVQQVDKTLLVLCKVIMIYDY